jgi:hypothetical protein
MSPSRQTGSSPGGAVVVSGSVLTVVVVDGGAPDVVGVVARFPPPAHAEAIRTTVMRLRAVRIGSQVRLRPQEGTFRWPG